MRVNREAIHERVRDIEALLPHLNGEQGRALMLWGGENAALMVATAVQVVDQLAEQIGQSCESVAAALQVNQNMAAMNLTNLEGFVQSFPEAAAGESEFVREHVLSSLSRHFAEELLADEGSQRFLDRVAVHAVAESQRIIAAEGEMRLPVAAAQRNDLVTVEQAEGCLRGLANVIDQANVGGLEAGLNMFYRGGVSFGSPLAGLEVAVRQAHPEASAGEVAQMTHNAAAYIGRFSRDLGQEIIVDMGRTWLRDNEADLIEQGRELEREMGAEYDDDEEYDAPLALQHDQDYADETEFSFGDDDCFSMDR